jgi:hypothetical protein
MPVISVKRGALMPVMSVKRGALMPVMSVKRGALIPVMSVNDKRGALMPVMSVDVTRDGFIAKADVVRAQDAANAIRLNFMVLAPLCFEKGSRPPEKW